jgi:uncharacterized DUF497 family protein
MTNKLVFDWDETKNRANINKHRISFYEASSAFYDVNARIIDDPDHSADEGRYILLGLSDKFRLLIVCHCYRQDEKIIRIISARKAVKKERQNCGN